MKSESVKHTPGPWRIGQYAHHDGRRLGLETSIFTSGDQVKVAVIEYWVGSARQEAECNALLIAAAPELLEACKLVVKWFAEPTNKHPLSEAKSAIEKAEGNK